jgi:hypothetical protein
MRHLDVKTVRSQEPGGENEIKDERKNEKRCSDAPQAR